MHLVKQLRYSDFIVKYLKTYLKLSLLNGASFETHYSYKRARSAPRAKRKKRKNGTREIVIRMSKTADFF